MRLPFLEIHNTVIKFLILIQGIYMECLIQHELYEKKKRLNESPEAQENRLTRQREYKS